MIQYKLRTLLIAMLAVSVACWLLFVVPDPAGLYIILTLEMVIPSVLTSGIIYFRGYRQTFLARR